MCGRGVEHARDRLEIALKIRRQNLDAGFGQARAALRAPSRKVLRAAVRQIVAIHAGDDHVAQAHRRRHARDVGRLVRIERRRDAGSWARNRIRSRACTDCPGS